MAEALIALPVLIIVLVAAMYLRELHLARASVRLSSRTCAWTYALDGCRGGAPAECNEPGFEASHKSDAVPDIEKNTQQHLGRADNPLSDVPVVRDALAGLFGKATTSQSTATVPFPFDPERQGVARAETAVVCNTVPTTVFDIAKELLCEHIGC
jgi:hypothetical protein